VHILTKMFVVLVSLLAIFMVPLVVVSTMNQEHWRQDALDMQTQVSAAQAQHRTGQQTFLAREAQLNEQLAKYSQMQQAQVAELEACRIARDEAETRLITAESRIVSLDGVQRTLSQGVKTAEELNRKLVTDLETLRERALTAERRRVELDERLAELDSQLQVAEAVQRALREENTQYKRDQRSLEAAIGEYTARYGSIAGDVLAADEGIAPDRNIEATVLDVARSSERTLVEIDAGSRDGVQDGWVMTVGNGGTFIGRLRIIQVDLNRATGVLTLENGSRGLAKSGHRAYALAGQH
jgi:vacuolar-type H+-ATPase subunit I/STV1